MPKVCTAAVLIAVMRLDSWGAVSIVLGAWSVSCVDGRSGLMVWVDCRCFLSIVFLGGARRLELSPCNTSNYCRMAYSHVICSLFGISDVYYCDLSARCNIANTSLI